MGCFNLQAGSRGRSVHHWGEIFLSVEQHFDGLDDAIGFAFWAETFDPGLFGLSG
jgi:hypothetical protein